MASLCTHQEDLPKDWPDFELVEYIHDDLPLMNTTEAIDILDSYSISDPKYVSYFVISRQAQRLADLAGQALVQCNARGISTSYGNDTYNYFFKMVSVRLPVFHGGDVPYTSFNILEDASDVNSEIAKDWQKYLIGFVLESNPNLLGPSTPMRKYGEEANVIQIDIVNITTETADPFKDEKCDVFRLEIWAAYGSVEQEEQEIDTYYSNSQRQN